MGLDMFLEERVYVGGQHSHRNVKGSVDITIGDEKLVVPLDRLSDLKLVGAYWRKANQIHAWFVENVQHGTDDCGEYYVNYDQLMELVATCKKILKKKSLARELLPTSEGFFFGRDDYGDYYIETLEYTVKTLSKLKESSNYYYRSSW